MTEHEIIPAAVPPANPAAAPIPPEFKAFSDVPIRLTIEIGRLQVRLADLIALKIGKIFRVTKSAGEPFDICANRQPVARGEVIVVENSAGVRITEVHKL